jgi:CubicO group peptidase (beta-lactamase class C family)
VDTHLQDQVGAFAEEMSVPGVAAGVLHGGEEACAFYGVTSVDNPLPVDPSTLFQFGSTGKTFTATAIMRLVERGDVDLDAPVRTYVPELRLRDEDVAAKVTVLQLLNHTAGWEGDLFDDTGAGDDALARYVERMAGLHQEFPPGAGVSYNNASLSLAGRVIEKVTGQVFERALGELVLQPLGMDHTFFFPVDIMTRRFSVGHSIDSDGNTTVTRPWAIPRSSNPAGGMSANVADQLKWARFHLGDGTPLLSAESLKRMQEPTAEMPGSALGDAVGISWLLSDVDGVRLVAHGGTTIGQYSTFLMVPERDFALVSMTNCGPNGPELNRRLQRWALQHYVGVRDDDPTPVDLAAAELEPYTGRYETIASQVEVTVSGSGLSAQVSRKEETTAALRDADDAGTEAEEPPLPLAMLGDGDRFVVSGGPGKGMRGYFTRDASGAVSGMHLGGRLTRRTGPVDRVQPGL